LGLTGPRAGVLAHRGGASNLAIAPTGGARRLAHDTSGSYASYEVSMWHAACELTPKGGEDQRDHRKNPVEHLRSEREQDQRFRWSRLVWWACQDLNLRPHPYQLNAGNRCAKRRSRRWRSTVEAEVMWSHRVQVCALVSATITRADGHDARNSPPDRISCQRRRPPGPELRGRRRQAARVMVVEGGTAAVDALGGRADHPLRHYLQLAHLAAPASPTYAAASTTTRVMRSLATGQSPSRRRTAN
jgi:hypothetical protein